MTVNLDARNLSLKEVRRILKLEEQFNGVFTLLLSLEALTEWEQQDLQEICNIFLDYYSEGKISEGQVKFLLLSPLMRLAGFYSSTIKITLEENIADISIEDEDILIKGRMDILAVNKNEAQINVTPFYILVIESKNSEVETLTGLPQLLTYAHKSLVYQEAVWGLATNGLRYQFVYLKRGNPSTYQLLPELNLIDSDRSPQILQVLKAICNLNYTVS